MKITGHDPILTYISAGLNQDRLSPSLLFVGPDGIGKKMVAVELAKTFCCQVPPKKTKDQQLPLCDECPSCVRIQGNNHTDLLIINRDLQATLIKEKPETQTAIKIESIRYLDKFLRIRPLE